MLSFSDCSNIVGHKEKLCGGIIPSKEKPIRTTPNRPRLALHRASPHLGLRLLVRSRLQEHPHHRLVAVDRSQMQRRLIMILRQAARCQSSPPPPVVGNPLLFQSLTLPQPTLTPCHPPPHHPTLLLRNEVSNPSEAHLTPNLETFQAPGFSVLRLHSGTAT